LPTIDEIQREANKIRRLYKKRHHGRPGRKPDSEIFLGAALFFLTNPERKMGKAVFTKDALAKIDELCSDASLEPEEIGRWLKSQAFKETTYENTWEWLRMGQKVWRFIEKNGPTSPREIQQRFKITAAEVEHLPCPTAAAFMNTKRPRKLFVDHKLFTGQKNSS